MGTSKNMHTFTDENFEKEVLQSELPVLIDFNAIWCGPCKLLSPIVDKLADELVGQVQVGTVDIDNSPNVAAQVGIRSVPTVMVFKGGQKVATHVGVAKREKLIKLLDL